MEGSLIVIEGSKDVLDEYLGAITEQPVPESVDQDGRHYALLGW